MEEPSLISSSSSRRSLSELPFDVLLKILSLLPLRSVLRLERVCRGLHHAVAGFLSVQKSLNLAHTNIHLDEFRTYHPAVVTAPSGPQFRRLLERCPRLTELVFLSADADSSSSQGLSVDDIVSSLSAHKSISRIVVCTNAPLLEALLQNLPHITVNTLLLTVPASLSLKPLSHIRKLHLRNISLTAGLPGLPLAEEIALINVRVLFPGRDSSEPLEFPCLRQLAFYAQKEKSMEEAASLDALIVALASSPCLVRLTLTLRQFSVLRRLVGVAQLCSLRELAVQSTGLYSATLQQFDFAGDVARICAKSASTLEHINLPSSILVKQFFQFFPFNHILLPQLRRLEANGIADTKLFLAPGNLVEARYYHDFLEVSPAMQSLSLHTYSGSLCALPLPLGLTDLTLPWDNRLDLARQHDEILSALSGMVNLESLAIAGVEEVEAVVTESRSLKRAPVFELSIPHLQGFKISNVCLRQLNLKGCRRLREFSLHCCPSLETLSLPAHSLEQVVIYEHYVPRKARPYLHELVQELATQPERANACHVHIQLHYVAKVSESGRTDAVTVDGGDMLLEGLLRALSDPLDYLVLKKQSPCRLEHNSGEWMFACTEFHPHPHCSSRSFDGIDEENRHRHLALEGISRWMRCIADLKATSGLYCDHLLAAQRSDARGLADRSRQTVSYCSEAYGCITNMPWLLSLSDSPSLSQPSEHSRTPSSSQVERTLNVPRLHVSTAQYCHSIPNLATTLRPSNPLLVVSIMEFVHNIHTLFYYA